VYLSRSSVRVVVLAHRICWTAGLACCAAGFEVALTLLLDGVASVCLFGLFPVHVLASICLDSSYHRHDIPVQVRRKIRLCATSTLSLSTLCYCGSDISLPARSHLRAI
jgi:hypothetical protein